MRAGLFRRHLGTVTMMLTVVGCQSTPPVAPDQLQVATLRSYISGHWYQETFRQTPNHRFEVEYRSDGSLFAREWDSAEYPSGTRKVWHHDYTGRWLLDGTKVVHHWMRGDARTWSYKTSQWGSSSPSITSPRPYERSNQSDAANRWPLKSVRFS